MEIISLGEDLDHGISPDYTVFLFLNTQSSGL